MILSLPREKVQYLVGDGRMHVRPLTPYSAIVCDFLDELSREIKAEPVVNEYPDVLTFSFWCRKGNILSLKKSFETGRSRLGLGLVFHVTPSNVPIHFAFSYAFGLLAGNANVVRVPSANFPQVDFLTSAVNRVFETGRYEDIKRMTAWVRYPADPEITGGFSSECRARMIWGGDQTVREIRQVPLPPRSVELVFPDRYSLCLIDSDSVMKLEAAELKGLARNFFNDAFLMDQNACSSPHLVVWIGNEKEKGRARFWSEVASFAGSKQTLRQIQAMEKYLHACEDALRLEGIASFQKYGNQVYLMTMKKLPRSLSGLTGKFGYFYQYDAKTLDDIAPYLNEKIQTMTFFGMERVSLLELVLKNRLSGVDRIVPIGKALDIGVIWDGFDVVGALSRIIDVA